MASASSITSWGARLALSSLRRSQLPTRVRGKSETFPVKFIHFNFSFCRDCRGIRYLCNLLDSVVTLAARKAKENGQKNILSEITGRDLGMQIGNPVPEASNQTHSLTATIFLNKDWQVDSDGGELRLSPSATTLATIPPVFDRVVFYPNHLVCPTLLPARRESLSCSVVYKG